MLVIKNAILCIVVLFKKDTKHQDFRKFLNGKFFGAFPSGFTSVACLQKKRG